MKRIVLFVVCGFTLDVPAIRREEQQPIVPYGFLQREAPTIVPYGSLQQVVLVRVALGEVRAEARNQAIDVLIAVLFLVGSGIPWVSEEAQRAANVSASVLWLTDSSIRLGRALKKWWMLRREPVLDIQSNV